MKRTKQASLSEFMVKATKAMKKNDKDWAKSVWDELSDFLFNIQCISVTKGKGSWIIDFMRQKEKLVKRIQKIMK